MVQLRTWKLWSKSTQQLCSRCIGKISPTIEPLRKYMLISATQPKFMGNFNKKNFITMLTTVKSARITVAQYIEDADTHRDITSSLKEHLWDENFTTRTWNQWKIHIITKVCFDRILSVLSRNLVPPGPDRLWVAESWKPTTVKVFPRWLEQAKDAK